MQTGNVHAFAAYKETKVKTANPGQIIVMLYDASIRNMDHAIELFGSNGIHYDAINSHLTKARDIITELVCSLDMEQGGEFAQRMFSLYIWFNQELLNANLKKDVQPIKTVRGMMLELRNAWAEIVNKVQVEPRSVSGVNIAG